MFSLFKKKEKSVPVRDIIWMNSTAKEQALLSRLQQKPDTTIICWFTESFDRLSTVCQANPDAVQLAAQFHQSHTGSAQIIFAEHYPLRSRENAFAENHHLPVMEFWPALDEPLFRAFGSERIQHLMQTLGMRENEPMEHAMISGAIRNAQEKLEKTISMEIQSTSQQGWFEKNYKG